MAQRIAAPAELPVSLDRLKAHLRLDGDDEDEILAVYLAAAVAHVDGPGGFLGQAIVTQSWREDFAGFEARMRLSVGPLQSVIRCVYLDHSGAEHTLDLAQITIGADSAGSYAELQTWPPAASVSIEYTAGHGGPDEAPPLAVAAILTYAGALWAQRESGAALAEAGHVAAQMVRGIASLRV